MDTLLYVGHILMGFAVLVGCLADKVYRRLRPGTPATSMTGFADVRVAELNGLFGLLLGLTAIGLGIAGLAGSTVVAAPVSLFVIAVGVISVLLSVDTTPTVYPVAAQGAGMLAERTAVVVGLPAPAEAGADRRAA